MPHHPFMNRLVLAELQYGLFNAFRTTKDDDALITIATNEAFASIFDSSRPGSCHFNRAVCRHASSLDLPNLKLLPPAAIGLEVPPSSLNEHGSKNLLTLGFRPAYSLCYLGADPDLAPAIMASFAAEGNSVSRLSNEQTDEFFDLLQLEGVDFPAEKRDRKRNFYCTDEFVAFVGKDKSGRSCAWATLYLNNGTGYLGNAFTLPDYRGRGFQAALLGVRMQYAKAAGASVVYTDVKHESQSQRNCERAGMRTVSINTIWTKGV